MSNEDYVSLEVAKMLKEKGFNEPCLTAYDKAGNIGSQYTVIDWNKEYNWAISRPTLYEAQKWLREKHNIHLATQCIINHLPTHDFKYKCEIYALGKNRGYRTADIRSNYEEVLNLGILEALKMI